MFLVLKDSLPPEKGWHIHGQWEMGGFSLDSDCVTAMAVVRRHRSQEDLGLVERQLLE